MAVIVIFSYIPKANLLRNVFIYTRGKKIKPVYVWNFFKAQILRALLSNKNEILDF